MKTLVPICFCILLASCSSTNKPQETNQTILLAEQAVEPPISGLPDHVEQRSISRLAFGSCAHQNADQPILDVAAAQRPDLFIWLGDNIYGDTKDMNELQAKYDQLAAKPEFQRLKESSTMLATWDDHDFGWNDAGRHYPFKKASHDIFLNFWEEPVGNPRWERKGIYTSYLYEHESRTLQVILIDNRTFRDNLEWYDGQAVDKERYHYQLDYWPNQNPDSTFLGETQWQWLEAQLKQPADLRVIGSGSQFGIEWNGYEAWANVPHEQQKFVDIIKRTKANGVLFISGDVHYAEVSKLEKEGCYPLYDITSSGITSSWDFATPNRNRIDGPIMQNHFGLLDIDWTNREVTARIMDVNGAERIQRTIPFSELAF